MIEFALPPPEGQQRYWLGWWANPKRKIDPQITGWPWWETGWRPRPRPASSFVALIDAESEAKAWKQIALRFGRIQEPRFCEVHNDETLQTLREGGRFLLPADGRELVLREAVSVACGYFLFLLGSQDGQGTISIEVVRWVFDVCFAALYATEGDSRRAPA